jgi:hypothetical protein
MPILCAYTLFIVLFFFQRLLIYASTRHGGVAEWSCSGLQLRVRRFDSDLRLQFGKARVVKSVDTGDLKSPAHKACQFESGLGHHSYTSKYGAYKEPSVKLVFLCLQKKHNAMHKKESTLTLLKIISHSFITIRVVINNVADLVLIFLENELAQ